VQEDACVMYRIGNC